MGLAERKYTPPPRTGLEVFMMLPEGTPAELIKDRIYMSPSPTYSHQKISGELFVAISNFIQKNDLGVCLATIDVFFDNKNILEPDIVFIAKNNLLIIKDDRIKGSPDLIIEILSQGNQSHDLEIKKDVYERFGIKEYYIVNPKSREVIAYYLENGKFLQQYGETGIVKSRLLGNSFLF